MGILVEVRVIKEDFSQWFLNIIERKNVMEFKIGDRVKVVKEELFEPHILGKVGTIKKCPYENKNGNIVAVVFDDDVNGHGLLGTCEYGHGWFCKTENLKRITNSKDKIVVTSDGKKVTAKLYNGKELIKSAEAKCCPDDEFNFEFGATLAMDRLFGHEPDKVKPKELLKNGMFGKHNNFGWFVVVDNKFIYFDGGHSRVEDYNDDLTSKYCPKKDYVEILVYASNLNSAKISVESNGSDIIWKR